MHWAYYSRSWAQAVVAQMKAIVVVAEVAIRTLVAGIRVVLESAVEAAVIAVAGWSVYFNLCHPPPLSLLG